MLNIQISPLAAETFKSFGDVIALRNIPDKIINQGLCGRHHNLARMDFGLNGIAGISLFDAKQRSLPYKLDMMERHPEGSQAFLPMSQNPFLVIVAPDNDGKPGTPMAFKTAPGEGVNYHINTWHGVLTPLFRPGLFAVIDRIGSSQNLEEYWFKTPITISGDAS